MREGAFRRTVRSVWRHGGAEECGVFGGLEAECLEARRRGKPTMCLTVGGGSGGGDGLGHT